MCCPVASRTRPPGIYKRHYVEELLKHAELDPALGLYPPYPDWDANADDDEPNPGEKRRRPEDGRAAA